MDARGDEGHQAQERRFSHQVANPAELSKTGPACASCVASSSVRPAATLSAISFFGIGSVDGAWRRGHQSILGLRPELRADAVMHSPEYMSSAAQNFAAWQIYLYLGKPAKRSPSASRALSSGQRNAVNAITPEMHNAGSSARSRAVAACACCQTLVSLTLARGILGSELINFAAARRQS